MYTMTSIGILKKKHLGNMGWLACRNRKSTSPKVGEAQKESNLLRIPSLGTMGLREPIRPTGLCYFSGWYLLKAWWESSTNPLESAVVKYCFMMIFTLLTVFPQCFCMS